MFSTSTTLLFTSLAVFASFNAAREVAILQFPLKPTRVTGTVYDDQIRLYSTGVRKCNGIYEIFTLGQAGEGFRTRFSKGNCLALGGLTGWDPSYAIASTSNRHNNTAPHNVSVFYWGKVDNQPQLHRAQWTDDAFRFVQDDRFAFGLSGASTQVLTTTSWLKNDAEYWSVFYYADRTITEILWDGKSRKRLPAVVIPTDGDIQDIQVISWIKNGQVFKALYVLANSDISEYFWAPDGSPTLEPRVIRRGVEAFSATGLANAPYIRINYKLKGQQDIIESWEADITSSGIIWSDSDSYSGRKTPNGAPLRIF